MERRDENDSTNGGQARCRSHLARLAGRRNYRGRAGSGGAPAAGQSGVDGARDSAQKLRREGRDNYIVAATGDST